MYVRDRHISQRPSRGEHSRNVRLPRAQKPRARFKLRDECRERRLLGQQRSRAQITFRAVNAFSAVSTRIAFRARHRRCPRVPRCCVCPVRVRGDAAAAQGARVSWSLQRGNKQIFRGFEAPKNRW